MKKKKKIIIIAGVALLLIIIVWSNISASQKKISVVSIEKVQKRHLVEKVSATGEIKPKKNINISTDVAGKILKIFVKEGDEVNKGQLLLKIDSTIYEANADRDRGIIAAAESDLISQQASLKMAKQYFERRKKLKEEGLISIEQFEDAHSQLEIAEANSQATSHRIEQAKASLKSTTDAIQKTVIVSPITGIVTSVKVEEGEVAIIGTMNNPGTVLLTIADLSVMEAEVMVDETDVVKVKPGKKAEIRVDALPDVTLHGLVTEVGNSAITSATAVSSTTASESRDFKTVVTLQNPPASLKPGFSATADIIIEEKDDVLAVPISALVIQENSKEKGKKNGQAELEGVFLDQGGICAFRQVTKGIAGDMFIEIVSGLKENDKVITGPFAALKKLKAGDKIRPAKKND